MSTEHQAVVVGLHPAEQLWHDEAYIAPVGR